MLLDLWCQFRPCIAAKSARDAAILEAPLRLEIEAESSLTTFYRLDCSFI